MFWIYLNHSHIFNLLMVFICKLSGIGVLKKFSEKIIMFYLNKKYLNCTIMLYINLKWRIKILLWTFRKVINHFCWNMFDALNLNLLPHKNYKDNITSKFTSMSHSTSYNNFFVGYVNMLIINEGLRA